MYVLTCIHTYMQATKELDLLRKKYAELEGQMRERTAREEQNALDMLQKHQEEVCM
jgi:hypothetical protein